MSEKTALVAPAGTSTEAGKVNPPALLDNPTTAPPAPAAFDSVTVHDADAPATRLAGVHAIEVSDAVAVTSEMDAVRVLPFRLAVTVAVWSLEIVPAVAVNVLLLEPDATVTEDGTDSAVALLDSPTAAPPVPAAFDSVTVQVELAPLPRVAGLHVSPLNTVGVTSEMDAVRVLPFRLAVTVAVWSLEIVPAVAVNVALLAPDATVTEDGTDSAVALLESETVALAGAAVFSETVQFEVPPELKEADVQLKPVRVGGDTTFAVTVPPEPLMVSASPPAVLPTVRITEMGTLVAVDAIVTLTSATTPFCITVVFSPATMQVYEPLLELQLIDLPADVALVPAVALIETTSAGEYASVH